MGYLSAGQGYTPIEEIMDEQPNVDKFIHQDIQRTMPDTGINGLRQYQPDLRHIPQQRLLDISQPEQDFRMTVPLNCIDVANHIKECPICSKFYNTDLTIYYIVIVVLAVLCILMMKKTLGL